MIRFRTSLYGITLSCTLPPVGPKCLMAATAWWAVAMDGYTADMLTENQRAAIERMLAEPESLAVEPPVEPVEQ